MKVPHLKGDIGRFPETSRDLFEGETNKPSADTYLSCAQVVKSSHHCSPDHVGIPEIILTNALTRSNVRDAQHLQTHLCLNNLREAVITVHRSVEQSGNRPQKCSDSFKCKERAHSADPCWYKQLVRGSRNGAPV